MKLAEAGNRHRAVRRLAMPKDLHLLPANALLLLLLLVNTVVAAEKANFLDISRHLAGRGRCSPYNVDSLLFGPNLIMS